MYFCAKIRLIAAVATLRSNSGRNFVFVRCRVHVDMSYKEVNKSLQFQFSLPYVVNTVRIQYEVLTFRARRIKAGMQKIIYKIRIHT